MKKSKPGEEALVVNASNRIYRYMHVASHQIMSGPGASVALGIRGEQKGGAQ